MSDNSDPSYSKFNELILLLSSRDGAVSYNVILESRVRGFGAASIDRLT